MFINFIKIIYYGVQFVASKMAKGMSVKFRSTVYVCSMKMV